MLPDTNKRPHSPRSPLARHLISSTTSPAPALSPEELWDLHGSSLFRLAFVSLGNHSAALRAVTLGMVDLYAPSDTKRHVPLDGSLQTAARCVYQRCQAMLAESSIQRTTVLPRPMVWLGELAHSQRDTLALCVFGGHDYRRAASLLGLAPEVTAQLLTSGLLELRRLAAAADPTSEADDALYGRSVLGSIHETTPGSTS